MPKYPGLLNKRRGKGGDLYSNHIQKTMGCARKFDCQGLTSISKPLNMTQRPVTVNRCRYWAPALQR